MANNVCPGCGRVFLVHGDAGEEICSLRCEEDLKRGDSHFLLGLFQEPVFPGIILLNQPEEDEEDEVRLSVPRDSEEEINLSTTYDESGSTWDLMVKALFLDPKRLNQLARADRMHQASCF